MNNIKRHSSNKLPPRLPVTYAVGLPINPLTARSASTFEDLNNRKLINASFENNLRLQKIILSNVQPLYRTNSKQVRLKEVKDALVSIALQFIGRNAQTQDDRQSSLNAYGRAVNKIRMYIPFSQALSPGKLLDYCELRDSPIDIVRSCLTKYYQELEINLELYPYDKHSQVMQRVGMNIDWAVVTAELDKVLRLDAQHPMTRMRKRALTPINLSSKLRSRVLLTTFTDETLDYLSALYNRGYVSVNLNDLYINCLTFHPIGGLIRFYFALLCEGVIRAITALDRLPPSLLYQQWVDILSYEDKDILDIRQETAEAMCLVYDVCAILEQFSTCKECKSIKDSMLTDVKNLAIANIPIDSKLRIGGFYV